MTTTAQQGGIRLLLIGGGKMGSAMLGGWLAGELQPSQCLVVEPDRTAAAALRGRHGVAVVGGVEEIADDVTPEMVVLAVKPQVMDDVLPPYRRFVRADTVFVSIAAGKSVTFLERALGDAAIVRAMPNTPAAVGRGITAAFANARVSARQRDAADRRLSAVGEVVWIDDEELINAVTALSGSGPAYVFHMIEAMAAAGVAAGLPEDLAMRLARATVTGAGELAYQSDESAAQLRINVTSPGGTTAAALEVLMDEEQGLTPLMTRAVAASAKRARELDS